MSRLAAFLAVTALSVTGQLAAQGFGSAVIITSTSTATTNVTFSIYAAEGGALVDSGTASISQASTPATTATALFTAINAEPNNGNYLIGNPRAGQINVSSTSAFTVRVCQGNGPCPPSATINPTQVVNGQTYTDTPSSSIPYGTGCGPEGVRLTLFDPNAVPRLNSMGSLRMSNGPASGPGAVLLGVGRTNVSLASIGMGGCSLYIQNIAVTFNTSFSGSTSTPVPFDIPNNMSLLGGMVTTQGAALWPAANQLGVASSNGLEFTIGL